LPCSGALPIARLHAWDRLRFQHPGSYGRCDRSGRRLPHDFHPEPTVRRAVTGFDGRICQMLSFSFAPVAVPGILGTFHGRAGMALPV